MAALAVVIALLAPLATRPVPVSAAGTDPVTLSDTAPGPVTWTSDNFPGGTNVNNTNGDNCFDTSGHPIPYTPPPSTTSSGPNACEVFTLKVDLSTPNFWNTHSGGVKFHSDEGTNDFDFYVYRRNSDSTKGGFITAAGATGGTGGVENFTIDRAEGAYYVAAVAYATAGTATGTFTFFVGKSIPNSPPNVTSPAGLPTFRASHDKFTSHSEPHMAMNPLNHANLVAGSKQYVNNKHYLFRIGMYNSFDGGQTWSDVGHLPVPTCTSTSTEPCSSPPDVTPADCQGNPPFSDACRFTTSDIWLSFDDEGNVYGIVLVSPSSNTGSGWEMWMYKSSDGGRTWPLANRRVIHNHIQRTLSSLFLDDKDAIAVDNYTQAGSGPVSTANNKPRDGKIGNIYACWGLDGAVAPTQNQVLSTSTDGGNTWGTAGVALPISGVNARELGCQIGVAPSGRVYVSFFVYALTGPSLTTISGVGQYLTWSDTRGVSFAPPIKVAEVNAVPNHLQDADTFRNLSLPAMAVSPQDGSVYLTWADEHKQGNVSDADIVMIKAPNPAPGRTASVRHPDPREPGRGWEREGPVPAPDCGDTVRPG